MKVMSEMRDSISVLESVHLRLSGSKLLTDVIYAIPNTHENDALEHHISSFGGRVFRGDENDVQSRFLKVAEDIGAEILVRVTGDCPLIDPFVVDSVIECLMEGDLDYCSNVDPPTFPDGLDVEAFLLQALRSSREADSSAANLEHVTINLRESGLYKTSNVQSSSDFSSLRWTIDYPNDLSMLSKSLPKDFLSMRYLDLIEQGVGIGQTPAIRNEGSSMSTGSKLWNRAKARIPGGSMLLSKRSEMFLPGEWPNYYSRAKGIEVWDLDGKRYLDFATMSVGACSLGYGNESVDLAVKKAIDDGVMSTLNSPAEVELADKLVSMHPWSAMARFARSGGEANAITIRIARAHTGKDKIAICGYHGWHDWYLAANLNTESNLDGHLLPGLEPAGVPRGLIGTTVPFEYNDSDALEVLLKSGEFAAVKMEVSRSVGPKEGFLEKVRELCDQYGALLIFDECTSGFRESFGGLHMNFGVDPDLAMFGKALGNGFAITAVLGTEPVMQSAQSTFISSTFWTERLGPVAALATLQEMENIRSWEKISAIGSTIKSIWSKLFKEAGIDFTIGGLDALPVFSLSYENWPVLRTLIIQEMLRRGFLTTSAFYSSTAHSDQHIDSYANALMDVVQILKKNLDPKMALDLLDGPVAHTGFKRLN
jgi:glutamate-1-semialdehyde aminotransferase/spore coat polysaccharide biosynthesis protein SpsF (cytidylyltransferase family)